MNGLAHALELLSADGPSSEDQDRLMQFGQFVGSWELDVSYYGADGTGDQTTAEWHWSWILGGKAILDVLVLPARPSAPPTDSYHTLVRVFDQSQDLWKVVWVAPQFGTVYKLTGSFSDDGGVVLHGDPHDGEPTRWVFSDVTPNTFLWEGFVKDAPDSDWRLEQRMTAQRTA
jgi:hypothetical protein